MQKALCLLFYLLAAGCLQAQVQPAEGASLHYRIIGFSFPLPDKSNNCKLEIARGNYYSEDSFKKNVVITRPCKGNRLIAEVPFFGERYTWRIVYADKRIQTDKSELHHFSTGIIPEVDTANIHLRILKSASKYKDAYVFLDNSRALYDMKGNPVWYIPDKLYKTLYPKGTLVAFRDIKLSNRGTITCLLEDKAYEINYNGIFYFKNPANVSETYIYHFLLFIKIKGVFMQVNYGLYVQSWGIIISNISLFKIIQRPPRPYHISALVIFYNRSECQFGLPSIFCNIL